jgi:predicted DNA-binding ribbon-helix-helix protein
MKTTVELPDALFHSVKETAARRKTTLKELFIHALKREVANDMNASSSLPFDVDELGLPILHNQTKTVSIDLVNSLRDDDAPTQ